MSRDGPGGPIAATQSHHDRHVGRPDRAGSALCRALDVGRDRDDDARRERGHGLAAGDEHDNGAAVVDDLDVHDDRPCHDHEHVLVDHRGADDHHHAGPDHDDHRRADDHDVDDDRADDLDDELGDRARLA
jgi:hypothetical protein